MDEFDPLKVDRDIARAARLERAWWRALRANADEAANSPWFDSIRYVTTRSTLVTVTELGANDPLRERLIAWVYRLAMTRIARHAIVDAARARQAPSVQLETPERGAVCPRELVHRALLDREPKRARAWLDGMADAAPILAAEKRLREAQIEIGLRLGPEGARAFATFDAERLRLDAERWLSRTSDLAASVLGSHEDLAGLLGALVARDVTGVWPRQPDARWLREVFRKTPLLDGLDLDLGPTPRAIGASSFARSLARFGAAYGRAAVLGGSPFVLASDPSEIHPMRRGALFGSLLLDPFFLRKRIDLSRGAAARTARSVAAAVLATLRLDALRTVVEMAMVPPSAIEEAASDALKVRVAANLAGLLPRPDARAPSRLLGAFLAAGDREMLRSRFDEDWFDNPQAIGFLRETDAAFRSSRVPNEVLDGAVDRLALSFEEILG